MLGTFAMAGAAYTQALSGAGAAAARAESKTHAFGRKLKILEASLAKSLMINEALWEMIRDNHGLTEKDLHEKIYEVDMRDGVLDGKNQRKASECPDCGHMVSARHPACIYCGKVMDESVFTMG